MRYAIVVSSRGGNTREVARALADAVRGAGGDVAYEGDVPAAGSPEADAAASADAVLAGFWTDKGDAAPDMQAFLGALEQGRVFLFGTAGFGGSDAYFEGILGRVRAHVAPGAEVVGGAMCQGRMAPAVRSRYEAMLAEHPGDEKILGMIENFDRAQSHPDAADIERIVDAARASLGF